MSDKFEDCRICANRGLPLTCAQCDAGEMFEPNDDEPLDFDSLDMGDPISDFRNCG